MASNLLSDIYSFSTKKCKNTGQCVHMCVCESEEDWVTDLLTNEQNVWLLKYKHSKFTFIKGHSIIEIQYTHTNNDI